MTACARPQPRPRAAAGGRLLHPAGAPIDPAHDRHPGRQRARRQARSPRSASSVTPGAAGPPDDAEVGLHASITDVRNASDLTDHTGSLKPLRPADHRPLQHPLSGRPGPGTVSDFTYTFAIPCTATADTGIGSTCSLDTTADALAPGTAVEGRRAIWQTRRGRGARRRRPAVPAPGGVRAVRRALLFAALALLAIPALARRPSRARTGRSRSRGHRRRGRRGHLRHQSRRQRALQITTGPHTTVPQHGRLTGTKIAFTRKGRSDSEIYVDERRRHGREQSRTTRFDDRLDLGPPDGTRLLYVHRLVRLCQPRRYWIFVSNADEQR